MKSQILKLISIFACVCLLLTAIIIPASAADVTYTKIDTVANLVAGNYIMAAYLTTDNNGGDLSAAPYHCFNGTADGKDLATSSYAFADGVLTAASSDNAVEVTLTAVEGKTNVYTISYGDKYLYSASAANRKLALGDTAAEWTASDSAKGGINFTDGSVTFGSASALSKFIRSYTNADTLKAGVTFFKTADGNTGDDNTGDNNTGDDNTGDDTTTTAPTVVDTPVANTAYKFGMVQENVSATDVYYLAGGMDGYYMATNTDDASAIDVYLEETTGGYYLYTMVDGVKTYINMVVSGTHVNGAYEATASTVYTYDADAKTVVATVNDALYWFGTRNDKTYTTVGPCATSYNGFYCQFYAVAADDEGGNEGGNEGDDNTGDDTTTTAPTLVDTPVANTAYKFGMVQENVSTTDVYYLAGGMDGYYMASTSSAASAIDVYLEETTGGYYLYTMVDGVKTYINMVVSGTHVNGAYEATASTVYTYDADAKTVVATVNDALYWFGTRNDKTYTTVGPCATSYNGFYCQFYAVAADDEGGNEGGNEGDDNTGDDTTVFDPTGKTAAEIVDAAYALGAGEAFEKNATLTGVITSVDEAYSTQYKNVTVTIAVDGADANKPIKCFRIKGDGADVIAVGDTITVTGIIKNYQHSSGDTEVEFDAGSTLDSYVKAENGDDNTGNDDTTNDDEIGDDTGDVTFTVVDTVVADTAYKFGMVQGNVSATDVYYLTGVMSGYYMGTTTNADEAIDVYLEATDGGYYLYTTIDGAKTYINMVTSGTYVNGAYEATASTVYTYDAESKTVVATVNDELYWFGTRNDMTYTTVGPCKTSYEGFYNQFYAASNGAGNGGTVGGDESDNNTGDDTAVFDPTGKTAAEIVNAAYALEPGKAFEKNVTLTGIVTAVNTAYSTQYGNVTITIAVVGADENKPIKCFRLKGNGADVIAVGDTVTVTGILQNYLHPSGDTEVEFDAGCTLDSYVKAQSDNSTGGSNSTGSSDSTSGNDSTGTPVEPINPDTGDSIGSCVAMAIAAAAVILYTSKKR